MTTCSPIITLLAAFFFNLSIALAAGTQFITGPCTSDADCADSCCGFNTGKWAGPVIAQERDGGCGFGDIEPKETAAVALGFTWPAPAANSSLINSNRNNPTNVMTASTTFATVFVSVIASAASVTGIQFITGPCQSDADCADGCCGFKTGLCAGPIVAQERDGGCGHGESPNSIAAQKLGFAGLITE